MYMQPKTGVILSIYVDDLKIGGPTHEFDAMWAKSSEDLDLDPAVNLEDNVYLGMRQSKCAIAKDSMKEKRELRD